MSPLSIILFYTNHEFDVEATSHSTILTPSPDVNNAARSGGYSPGAALVEWTTVGALICASMVVVVERSLLDKSPENAVLLA